MKTMFLDGVEVISETGVLIEALGEDNWANKVADYAKESEIVMKYCLDNNAAYFAAPVESFSYELAVAKAKNEGKTKVVVDCLS